MKKLMLAAFVAFAAVACGDNTQQNDGINSDQATTTDSTINSGGTMDSGNMGTSTDTATGTPGTGTRPDSLPGSPR
jgi:hypothetical protein